MKEGDLEQLGTASRHFAAAATAMMALLLLIVGGTLIDNWGSPGVGTPELFLVETLELLPALFYLCALIALRATFRDIGGGATFQPTIRRGLRRLGWALLGGGLAGALVVPATTLAIVRPLVASGTVPPGRYGVRIDATDLILPLVAVLILLLARLLGMAAHFGARAIELEAELDEFL